VFLLTHAGHHHDLYWVCSILHGTVSPEFLAVILFLKVRFKVIPFFCVCSYTPATYWLNVDLSLWYRRPGRSGLFIWIFSIIYFAWAELYKCWRHGKTPCP
jgi:hypothetical protein